MAFDTRVEEHHKLMYINSFQLATAQRESKLRKHVTEKPCAGEGAVAADLIGPAKLRRRTDRRKDNTDNPLTRTRRWLIYRDEMETGFYLDSADKFRQIDDPSSELMKSLSEGANRAIDDIILGIDEDGSVDVGGILGAVTQGKTPSSQLALPAEFKTVHGSAGLTIAKLRAARLKLGLSENQIDMTYPVMAITERQHDDLLGIVAAGTGDLNQLEQPQLKSGRVTMLMGFVFEKINRLPLVGTARQCPVWLPENIVLGVWQDAAPKLLNDSSKGDTPHASISLTMDATRKEDLGVHVIECTEA